MSAYLDLHEDFDNDVVPIDRKCDPRMTTLKYSTCAFHSYPLDRPCILDPEKTRGKEILDS